MNVLVAGGGMVGSETATFLGMHCKTKVSLLEMRPEIEMDMEAGFLMRSLESDRSHSFIK